MLKINHDCIEYNHTPALQFTPNTPDYIRRDIKDMLEFALNDAQMIEDGDYIEVIYYNEMKHAKEELESKCQCAQDKLERLLDDIDRVLEQGENEALKLVAEDLESILLDLRG